MLGVKFLDGMAAPESACYGRSMDPSRSTRAIVAAALLSTVLFSTFAFAVPGHGNGPPDGFPGQGHGPPEGRGGGPSGLGQGGPSVNTVPEPSTLLLSLAALGLLVQTGRR